ncbi:MAG: amino acid adenylation domain-containing protein, partial [Pseudomonadota bacterium]
TTVPLSLQLNTDWGLSDLIKNVRASWKTALRASRNTPSQIGPALPVSVNFIPDLMPDFLGSPSRQLFGSMAPSAIGSDLNLRFVPQASGDIEVVLRIAEDAREKLGHLDLLGLWVRVMDELLAGKALSDVSLSGDAEHDAAHDAAALAYSAPAPTHKTLVSAFLAQVAVNPSRIAVRDGAASVRFDELEQMSHKIALALMQRGVGKGDVIATCLPRSANVVAAMLGILRTGAAYYSIDTRLPAERLEATLVESQAKLVICARGMPTAGLGAVSTVEVEQLLKDNSETRALPAINPHSAMYVMFTSGSTGVPNGVRVPHESFMRYQAWAISLLTDSADQPLNWSLSTSLAFESAYRSFVTLQTGGTMHCYDAPDHVTGMSAVHALEDDQCDGIALTPSHLRQLVHKRWDVKRLSKLISIGEPLSIELAHKTRAAFPDVDLINLYGPTESTMAITAHFFQADRDKTATVPIGRCPPDAVVHVLDPSLRPVPPGIPGEIVVGGPRLSLGYLNNPALMTQRFVDDPFYQGGTLYRTGDVGIVTERGDLLHLGRQDTQVKINGQRVELGEVEAAVMRHPDIMDCAVIAVKNNQDATDELVAFYVSPDHPPVADIRQTAATMLARTIMPRAYVRIDEVPHLPSGKTDRLRLQKMLKDKPRREEQGFGAPPKGNTEVQLAQLWSDILKQTSISRDDDFFDLGGDSLSFMRMILSLERHFDLKLPLERLTAATTLKAVAHWLSGSIEPKTRTRRKPVVENRSAKEVPVSSLPIEELSEDAEFEHVQHRIMLATENWPGRHMGRKMPIMAQNETGSDQALIWCFNARHEPASLGPLLGPTRPLYALRSMNAIVARGASRERFKQAFVAAYAAELMDLLPGQSLLMGGNCQSARLIVSLAQEIVHRGGQVDRICLLEHAPNETLNFNLSLFFGRDSVTHNPFLHSAEPQKEWKRLFPSVTWDVIPGQHGEYFQPGHIEEFAAKLEQRLQVRKDL